MVKGGEAKPMEKKSKKLAMLINETHLPNSKLCPAKAELMITESKTTIEINTGRAHAKIIYRLP